MRSFIVILLSRVVCLQNNESCVYYANIGKIYGLDGRAAHSQNDNHRKIGMIKKRERIRRFLGWGTSSRRHQGGIENLLPARITGWAVSNETPFHEVRLLVGSTLIARAEINQPRKDVCDKLDYTGNPGFSLLLPGDLPPTDWSHPTRLLAISVDGSYQAELQLLTDPKATPERLKDLLQSDILGLEGHFDGIVLGALQGWATRKDHPKPTQVWLQSEGHEPIALICDQFREDMEHLQLARQCGFRFALAKLPATWRGKDLRCSFDRDGVYFLPQNHPVNTPIDNQLKIINTVHKNETGALDFGEEVSPKNELNTDWDELEIFSLILDEVETKLNVRDAIAAEKQLQPSKMAWLTRLLRNTNSLP